MNRKNIAPVAILALSLFACNAESESDHEVTSVDLDQPASDMPEQRMPPPPPPANGSADEPNDGFPNLDPAPLTPEAEKTETGARNVLLAFARAIELKEWDQAWAMLDDASKARWPKAQWTSMFDDLRAITVAVPNGSMEGAAGSSYYSTDLTITADDAQGRPIRYEGPIVLRRSNDVPGATVTQRHWSIYELTLDATH